MSKAIELAKACVPDHESELPLSSLGRAVLVGSAADLIQAALEEARAKAIEKAAQVAADAYTEYWRISNEHEVHWRAWRQSGEVGEMPTISLGPMSDFIASRIRALLSAPTEARTVLEASHKGVES